MQWGASFKSELVRCTTATAPLCPPGTPAFASRSRGGGTFLRVDGNRVVEEDDDEHRRGKKSPWAAEVRGFNVHAGVLVHAGDREGLERLCRYGARPPFSLERISLLPDGRVAYLLKKPRRNGATHLVMTPVQFLARIAILIPPPRFPLQRFSGVFAPNSTWRAAVIAMRPSTSASPRSHANPLASTPRPPTPPTRRKKKRNDKDGANLHPDDAHALVRVVNPSVSANHLLHAAPSANDAQAAPHPRPTDGTSSPLPPSTSLGAGLVPPRAGRLDWASLIRRVYLHDILACPCGGRREIIADVHDPLAIRAILGHLGLPADAPPIARARAPSYDAA